MASTEKSETRMPEADDCLIEVRVYVIAGAEDYRSPARARPPGRGCTSTLAAAHAWAF